MEVRGGGGVYILSQWKDRVVECVESSKACICLERQCGGLLQEYVIRCFPGSSESEVLELALRRTAQPFNVIRAILLTEIIGCEAQPSVQSKIKATCHRRTSAIPPSPPSHLNQI